MIAQRRDASRARRRRLRLTPRGRATLALLAATAVGVGVGAVAVPREVPVDDGGVLDEAAARIAADAVEPVTREELERAAMDAMIRRLGDPWSSWQPGEDEPEVVGTDDAAVGLPDEDDGDVQTGTVGLRLDAGPDADEASPPTLRVAGVVPGSSAAEAGVPVGATVEAVDGEPASGIPTALTRLRGPEGSRVTVRLRHPTGAVHRVTLTREVRPTVEVLRDDATSDVVRLRVSAFSTGSGRAVRDAVRDAAAEGVDGIVLDLRGNGGGLLHEAVETASAFLGSGPVLTYQRRGEAPRPLEVVAPGDTTTPLVVLVDGGTASAAEVVAAALADRRGAVLVGGRTVGKGSVQEPVLLADGTALRLTVARYLPPSGQVVEGVGLEPDVEVSATAPAGVAELRAGEVLLGLVADAGGAVHTGGAAGADAGGASGPGEG